MIFQNRLKSLILLLILMLPVADMLTFLTIESSITFGQVYKVFLLVIMGLFVFCYYQKPNRKLLLLVFISIVIFILLYLKVQTSNDLTYEISGVFRTFYFIFFTLLLYCIRVIDKNLIEITLINDVALLYAVILIVTTMLGIDNSSFVSDIRSGSSGIFNSANEIGIIISISLGVLVLNFSKRVIFKITVLLVAALLLGVKTPIITLFLCLVFIFLKCIYNNRKNLCRTTFLIGVAIIIVVISVVGLKYTAVYKNIVVHTEYLVETQKYGDLTQDELYNDPYILLNEYVLSQRLDLVDNINDNIEFNDYFLGIGFYPKQRSVEMDFVEYYYRIGIIGFLFYFSQICYIIYLVNKISRYTIKRWYLIFIVVLISFLVGHTLSATSVAMIVALLLIGREGEYESNNFSASLKLWRN